jgi:hypothetical protein
MDENKQKFSFLQRLPDVVKGWLGLIIAIAGIIIAVRTDRQLYVFLFMGIILLVWLSTGIYLVFARSPGTFSKKGAYRYENYRWAAFISIGFVIGFILSFSLFKPNRLYISQAFMGTPTPTASPTVILPTPTVSVTPFPTATETPIPTPTPIILFQENFLNNKNGWNLPVSYHPLSYTVTGKIIGGKLEYALSCSISSYIYKCENWLEIPYVTAKDFELMFDARIVYNRNNGPINIGVRFRSAAAMNYTIYFSNKGNISVLLLGNGLNDFLARDVFSRNINQDLNETNHFKIVAKDSLFMIYANEKEIIKLEDGNNNSIGKIFLGINMPNYGNAARIEIDNIEIQGVR